MVEQNKLSELTDDELYQRLKFKQTAKSWTVGELYEVERRGFQLLDSDPALRTQLQEIRDNRRAKVSETIKPWLDRQFSVPNTISLSAFEHLTEIIKDQNKMVDWAKKPFGIAVPKLEFPTGSLQGLTGPVPESVSQLEIDNPKTDEPLAKVTFENLMAEVKETNKLLSRDSVFWVIAVSTVISAITSIWILVLTIRSR